MVTYVPMPRGGVFCLFQGAQTVRAAVLSQAGGTVGMLGLTNKGRDFLRSSQSTMQSSSENFPEGTFILRKKIKCISTRGVNIRCNKQHLILFLNLAFLDTDGVHDTEAISLERSRRDLFTDPLFR